MTAPIAAAVILRKEREIVDAFRHANASVPGRAESLEALNVHDGIGLRRLRRDAVIRETTPGRFYLDEDVYAALRGIRRRFLAVVLLLVAFVVLVGLISFRT